MMRIIRNSLLLLLSFSFLIILPVAAFINSINSTILKPYGFTSYLDQSGVYRELEAIIKNELTDSIDSEENDINKIIGKILNDNLTDGMIAAKLRAIQTSFWDFFLDKTDTISPIPINDFKYSFLQSLDLEIEKMAKAKGLPANLIKKDIIQGFSDKIPDSFDITKIIELDHNQLFKLKAYYQKERNILLLSYILLATIILLGLVISFNFKRFLKWLGLTFTVSGVITLIPILFTYFFLDKLILSKIEFPAGLNQIQTIFSNVLETVINETTIYLLIISSIILVTGILSLIISNFMKNKKDKALLSK